MWLENETKKFVEPSAECNNPAERGERASVGEESVFVSQSARESESVHSVCGRLNGMAYYIVADDYPEHTFTA